jgi:hypothetical protein
VINPLLLLRRVLANPKTTVFLYSAIATYATAKLVTLAKEQLQILDNLDQAVAERRGEYDELWRQHQALLGAHAGLTGEYPGPVDLDPLGRGRGPEPDATGELPVYEETAGFNGFEPAGVAADAG